jgi:transposase-like protein
MRKRSAQAIQRRSRWQEIVRGQRQSGQSVRAYCRQAGVEESAFYWWRRELERRSGKRSDGSPSGRKAPRSRSTRSATRGTSGAMAEVGFLPVQVTAGRRRQAEGSLELVLGGERVLRIPSGFDRQTLREVLAVLEVQPC